MLGMGTLPLHHGTHDSLVADSLLQSEHAALGKRQPVAAAFGDSSFIFSLRPRKCACRNIVFVTGGFRTVL